MMRPLSAIIAALPFASAASAQEAGFWLTGRAPGTTSASVRSLSQDSSLAAGYSIGLSPSYLAPGFTWTRQGGRDDFGLAPGLPPGSAAFALNSDGTLVVGVMEFVGQQPRAYRRIGNGPLENLGVLPNETRSVANGVSGDGSIVVGNTEHDVPGPLPGVGGQAFRWTEGGGMQGLGYLHPNGYHSEALAISRDGTTIVGRSQSNSAFDPDEAFRWTQSGGMEHLPTLPGVASPTSSALAVSADGAVIVGSAIALDGRGHAVRWTASGVQDLGLLPGRWFSTAYAVSDNGLVIGGLSSGGGPEPLAFVWSPALGMTDLSSYLLMHGVGTPANYRLESIYAISGDGLTFGGNAINLSTNLGEGFVATIPSAGATMVLLLAPLVTGRRRRG